MKNVRTARRRATAFTLIELLVVLAIIAILAAILFPVFARAKESARTTECLTHLRQVGIAWQMYANDSDDLACPSYYYSPDYSVEYAWDFTVDWSGAKPAAKPGMLHPYLKSTQIQGCRAFSGESWGRPHTGYGYNTTYLGGDVFVGVPAAAVSSVGNPTATVLLADAAFGDPLSASNFLRAPSDPLFSSGLAHFRHNSRATVIWVDSHATTRPSLHKGGALGGLSRDDELYDLQ